MINKEKQKETQRKYWLNHYEEIRRSHKEYYGKHKEERRRYIQEKNWGIKVKLINLLGGCCRRRGCSDPRVLQINHKNGDGRKESRRGMRRVFGKPFYLEILNGERATGDLELLCANCNIIYEYEQGKRFKYLDLA